MIGLNLSTSFKLPMCLKLFTIFFLQQTGRLTHRQWPLLFSAIQNISCTQCWWDYAFILLMDLGQDSPYYYTNMFPTLLPQASVTVIRWPAYDRWKTMHLFCYTWLMNEIKTSNYVLMLTDTTYSNDMTCQFTCTPCMSYLFNVLAPIILTIYTMCYV